MSVTVRISPETRETVQRIARESNESMQSVIAKAAEEYKRYLLIELIERTNEAFAALRVQPKRWAEELEERHLWNAILNDDLEEVY